MPPDPPAARTPHSRVTRKSNRLTNRRWLFRKPKVCKVKKPIAFPEPEP